MRDFVVQNYAEPWEREDYLSRVDFLQNVWDGVDLS